MSTLGVQSPVSREPPPAPRLRPGLTKNFNGSMLFLMNPKHAESTPQFETNDPERRGGNPTGNNSGGSRGSYFRASDLLSQGRSSASSLASRGSLSGWFPIRPNSATGNEGDQSREGSPMNSPSGGSRSSLKSNADDTSEREKGSSSSLVGAIKQKRKDLTSKIRNTFTKRPSNLGKKEQPIVQILPPYISVISAPATSVSPPKTGMYEYRPHDLLKSPIPTSDGDESTTQDTTEERKSTSFTANSISIGKDEPLLSLKPKTTLEPNSDHPDVVSQFESKGADRAHHYSDAEEVGDLETSEEDDGRNDLLKAADLETIEVLQSRIGDLAAATTVVRVARAGEAWMRDDVSGLLCSESREHLNVPTEERSKSSEEGEVHYSSIFYGEKRPKIALDRYLGRLVRYLDSFSEGDVGVGSMGILALLGGVVLIDRLAARTNFAMDSMNAHRVFMVATLVAFKILDDEPCSNEYYANVGGVDLAELNVLEASFLKALEFRVHLDYQSMYIAMNEFFGGKPTQILFKVWHERVFTD